MKINLKFKFKFIFALKGKLINLFNLKGQTVFFQLHPGLAGVRMRHLADVCHQLTPVGTGYIEHPEQVHHGR
jgi:hypothetical protein